MDNTQQEAEGMPLTTSPTLQPLAPVLLMTAFWMLLGAASGIRVAQSIWQLLGWDAGDISVAVPVGGVVGAAVGAALGQISSPRLLVLLMAVFAGAAAGGVAGKIPWGEIGEIGGQVAGGLVGGIAWAAWLFFGQTKEPTRAQPVRSGRIICSQPRPLTASPPDRISQ